MQFYAQIIFTQIFIYDGWETFLAPTYFLSHFTSNYRVEFNLRVASLEIESTQNMPRDHPELFRSLSIKTT